MTENFHPLKEAIIDLGTWVDTWRGQPGLETLADAVREAWMDYVGNSGMFEFPRADGKLADVIPLRRPKQESPERGGLRSPLRSQPCPKVEPSTKPRPPRGTLRVRRA